MEIEQWPLIDLNTFSGAPIVGQVQKVNLLLKYHVNVPRDKVGELFFATVVGKSF